MTKYKVHVTDDCIACNACVSACEENFEMNDDNTKAKVKKSVISDKELAKNQEAKEICPVEAIKIEES
ncbi:ferredoxin [Candidatus Woesearchaeota archaeon]|nr:ferredoxin [Candidatus Woesearchaeota archaeon]